MVTTTLNVLFDLVCSLGNASRLAKLLREQGFRVKIVSYDLVRLREKLEISAINQEIEDRLSRLFNQVLEIRDRWSILCMEVWVEKTVSHISEPRLFKYDDLCIYTRVGARNRVIYKLAWLSSCREARGLIPEAITRACVSSNDDISGLKSAILKFAKAIMSVNFEQISHKNP
jgi:hypothetical protein